MSRDSAGLYTLPGSVNPVVLGTLITPTWAITTLNDLAAALTDSFSRTGKGAMLASAKMFSGTRAAPGLTWDTEVTTGFYRASAGDMRAAIADADVFGITASGAQQTDGAGTLFTAGFREIPQVISDADRTCVISDRGKHIYRPQGSTVARIWTIPANASVPFPIGTAITFDNDGTSGNVTIAITTDVLVLVGPGTTGSRILAPGGQATALKVTATRWRISGVGLS